MQKQFPTNLDFRFSWRKYQKRVLENIAHHLTDSKIHIVAPPGSGKTVLGLQITIQLNKPTLILAPTITIRNQWIERLCQDFNQGELPDWISTDIKNLDFLTVSTYQALHIAVKNEFPLEAKLGLRNR